MKAFRCKRCGKKCFSATIVEANCPYCGAEIEEISFKAEVKRIVKNS